MERIGVCTECDCEFIRAHTGRPRITCGDRCRQAARTRRLREAEADLIDQRLRELLDRDIPSPIERLREIGIRA